VREGNNVGRRVPRMQYGQRSPPSQESTVTASGEALGRAMRAGASRGRMGKPAERQE
jgi:hypothetical protein